MEFYETADGRIGLREVPVVFADLLRQIPNCGDRESEAVESRLFPTPSLDASEEDLRDDWKAHVQPGLHELFLSSRQVVEADLRAIKEEDEACSLEFPVKHADAWMNALNQARLALAAQHGLGDKELEGPGPMHILNERDLALLQIDFYGGILQWLVQVMED
jgi:hypothetical protein